MAENSIFTSSSSSIVGGLLSAIARNKIESIVLRYIVKNKKEETQMKVIKRKRCMLNHRGRIRSLKFPPSHYCGCVTAPAKVLRVVSGLFFQLFVCLFS